MGKTTVYSCDKCHGIISHKFEVFELRVSRNFDIKELADLCRGCYQQLLAWIKEQPK
jgi:hypothetical protein